MCRPCADRAGGRIGAIDVRIMRGARGGRYAADGLARERVDTSSGPCPLKHCVLDTTAPADDKRPVTQAGYPWATLSTLASAKHPRQR